MRAFFYIGWVFLLCAFAAAAAEVVPRMLPGGAGAFVSAHDLWYAAWPGSLVVTQIQVERFSPVLWDPLILGLLQLPAWLLAGLPGGLMLWAGWPDRQLSPDQIEDLERQEESLRLFDALAREARTAGFPPGEDDQAPDHGEYDLFDDPGIIQPYDDNDLFPDFGPEGGGGDGGSGGGDPKG